MSTPQRSSSARPLLIAILSAVGVWGLVLAIGAGLEISEQQGAGDIRKFALVAGVTMAFLTFWGGLLWWRSRRLRAIPPTSAAGDSAEGDSAVSDT